MQWILVDHYAKHFASYKKQFGAESGSSKWSTEGKDLVRQQFPFVKDEFVFHKRSKSAFDLYSPPHDMAIELAMFRGTQSMNSPKYYSRCSSQDPPTRSS